jgi:hypothetical protein
LLPLFPQRHLDPPPHLGGRQAADRLHTSKKRPSMLRCLPSIGRPIGRQWNLRVPVVCRALRSQARNNPEVQQRPTNEPKPVKPPPTTANRISRVTNPSPPPYYAAAVWRLTYPRFATCRERVRREAPYMSEGMCPHSKYSSDITLYLRTKRRESAAQRKPTC